MMRTKEIRGWLGVVLIAIPHFLYAQAQGETPAPRFDISRYEVTGNTLLPAADIERVVAPYTGQRRDFGDIQRALEALEQVYRERGYGIVQVSVPEQDITRGI